MNRRVLVGMLTVILLAMPGSGGAQAKIPRIGVLRVGAPSDASTDIFRQTLRDLGYVEGRNIAIEYRWAEGQLDRLPDLAADLVSLKVDVIVAGGVAGARAAKQATSSIPIPIIPGAGRGRSQLATFRDKNVLSWSLEGVE